MTYLLPQLKKSNSITVFMNYMLLPPSGKQDPLLDTLQQLKDEGASIVLRTRGMNDRANEYLKDLKKSGYAKLFDSAVTFETAGLSWSNDNYWERAQSGLVKKGLFCDLNKSLLIKDTHRQSDNVACVVERIRLPTALDRAKEETMATYNKVTVKPSKKSPVENNFDKLMADTKKEVEETYNKVSHPPKSNSMTLDLSSSIPYAEAITAREFNSFQSRDVSQAQAEIVQKAYDQLKKSMNIQPA